MHIQSRKPRRGTPRPFPDTPRRPSLTPRVNLPCLNRSRVSVLALMAMSGLGYAQLASAVEITKSTTDPVSTSTIDDGAADDITITDDGTIVADTEAGFVAVTVDSSNDVTNDGTIKIEDFRLFSRHSHHYGCDQLAHP